MKGSANLFKMSLVKHRNHKYARNPQAKIVKRRLERKVRDDIQRDMDDHVAQLVMRNRISWSAYDKIQKTEGLTATPKRKRQDQPESENLQSAKRRHSCKQENLGIDIEQLLQEGSEKEQVNWSQLASRYGLITANRGQVIKEFLQEHNIAAACVVQRACRTLRRAKKKFKGGKVSHPMHKPILNQKQQIMEKVRRGKLTLGEEVVAAKYSRYKIPTAL